MQFNQQLKIWFAVSLIHATAMYTFSRTIQRKPTQKSITVDLLQVEQPEQAAHLQTPSVEKNTPETQTKENRQTKKTTHIKHEAQAESISTSSLPPKSIADSSGKAGSTTNLNAPKASPSSPPKNPTIEHTSSTFTAPTHIGDYLHNPAPTYPPLSREAGEEGVVKLAVMVQANGRAASVEVIKSSGHSRLDHSARTTVMNQYLFIPATQGGQAVAARYTFEVSFRLRTR